MQGGGRDKRSEKTGGNERPFPRCGFLSFAVSAGRAQHWKAEQKVELFNGSLPNEDQLRVRMLTRLAEACLSSLLFQRFPFSPAPSLPPPLLLSQGQE